jgi:hypothetical protein
VSDGFVDAPGELVLAAQLRAAKARDLAERLSSGSIPFASLLECRTAPTFDAVVLEIETEIPQIREHDIRAIERLAVCFDRDDSKTPEVVALREDFPETAHLYPPVDVTPKQLCVFEEEYAELRRRWTAAFFVRRVQDWLRLTARGELHAQDQPLEQALAGAGHRIILPHKLRTPADIGSTGDIIPLHVTDVDEHRGSLLILAAMADGASRRNLGRFSALSFTSSPHGPGVIATTPRTISELHAFLAATGDDLVATLRNRLLDWPRQPEALAAQLILIVRIPKRRDASAAIESIETWAFLGPSVQEVGNALGVWESTPAGIGLMIPVRSDRRGESASLDALAVHFRISRADAAQLNGRNAADDRRIVGIGAGALGSQVILNCAKAAFGRWTIIDRDRLLPHNVARHALGDLGVGYHKALVLANAANRLTDDEPAFEPVVADVLAPGAERATLEERLGTADLVVDLAASIPVAGYLANDARGAARCVSFFLNPVGSDLVMLAEDRERQIRLDVLEMQYYRSILREPRLRDHLRRPEGPIRYGRSCRDVTLRLPQALVALHAASAARQLASVADHDAAVIRICQADEESPEVSTIDVMGSPVNRRVLGAWTVLYDDQLLDTIQRLRRERLPNETGGILVGSFDIERKIIYVVDTIPSPVDSEERRTLYIRGCEGLQEQLSRARQQTFEQLEYVGEWHSHPDGFDCLPSGDDLNVLSWLTTHMDADGVPGVMMIGCERNQLAILLSQVAGA